MAQQDFQLQFVTLSVDDALSLALCHGFREVSHLGDKTGRALVGLRAKINALLEEGSLVPATTLHRRLTGKGARLEQIVVVLEPAKKRADWREPVELRFDYVAWTEAADLHLAFVPALGIQVIAAKPEQVAERVKAHIHLALVDRVKRVTLKKLAASQVSRVVSVAEVTVSAKMKTPADLEEENCGGETKKSVLNAVATRITHHNSRSAFEIETTLQQLRDAFDSARPSSVLLVGPPGVGKSAAVQEFACTTDQKVWQTSGGRLIAGQTGFGQWQERCRDLCREVAEAGVILHLGNLIELMEVGQHSANTQSIAAFLRPWIERGEILVIAECTPEQLSVIERRDPHIAGAFLVVHVHEPAPQITRRILEKVFDRISGRAECGYDPKYGARPLKRELERQLITPLAEALNGASHGRPLLARVACESGALRIDLRQRETGDNLSAAHHERDFLGAAVRLRRRMSSLGGNSQVVALENEAPVLAALERRPAKQTQYSPENQARLARLKQIREILATLAALTRRADDLETATLTAFHTGERFNGDAARQNYDEILREMRVLQRAIFRLKFPNPDDIVIAVFGEDRAWLTTMLRIYLEHTAAQEGQLVAFDFILPPPGRAATDAPPLRKKAEKITAPWEKPPDTWVGAVLHLRGDLFHGRFLSEAGLHKHVGKNLRQHCLVEASDETFERYAPPPGIHRAGAIKEKEHKLRRFFDANNRKVTDGMLGASEWLREEPDVAMRRLIEERLLKAVEQVA